MALVNFSSFIYKLRRHLFTHRKSRLVRECLIYPSWRSRAITICRGESGRLETKEVCGQSNGTELRPYSVFRCFRCFSGVHGISWHRTQMKLELFTSGFSLRIRDCDIFHSEGPSKFWFPYIETVYIRNGEVRFWTKSEARIWLESRS